MEYGSDEHLKARVSANYPGPGMPIPPNYEIVYQPITGFYRVRLSVSLQQYCGVYVEPDGTSETAEDENKWFVWTPEQLHNGIAHAIEMVDSYRGDVLNARALERMGATYQDTMRIWAKRQDVDDPIVSDSPYDANEDLAFLYGELSLIHSFLNEALSHIRSRS